MDSFGEEFWRAAFVRAIRTVFQTALALLGTTAVTDYINWRTVIISSLLAGAFSLFTSITTGLPEVENGNDK